jgi:spore germination cell wall hydrolase CwlJ-like protein
MRHFSAAVAVLCALAGAGCTTSGTSSPQLASTVAEIPDLAFAPIPAIKPTTVEAKASLTAEVEANVDEASVVAAAFASEDGKTAPAPVVAKAKTIPDEAIEVASAAPVQVNAIKGTSRDRECLMRAMYFESNRSSRDGQLAVGTVVMHRLASGRYGSSVCSVVGAPQQFAPGVMSRRMQGDTDDLSKLASAILAGKRHPGVAKNVMFFHTAGLKFPYRNMRYVLVAGGNTFYYKAGRRRG